MKKFKFKLGALLEHRKRKEDNAKKELADLNKKLEDESKKLRQMENKLGESRNELQLKQADGAKSHELKIFSNFINSMTIKINEQSLMITDCKNLVECQRRALIELSKERKAIERLQETKHIDYIKTVRADEQKMIDEMAVLRHGRSASQRRG